MPEYPKRDIAWTRTSGTLPAGVTCTHPSRRPICPTCQTGDHQRCEGSLCPCSHAAPRRPSHRATCPGPPTCLGIPCRMPPPTTPTHLPTHPVGVGATTGVAQPSTLPPEYYGTTAPQQHTAGHDDYKGWDQ